MMNLVVILFFIPILGIFKLLNGLQTLDVSALQQIIMKLENTADEVFIQ